MRPLLALQRLNAALRQHFLIPAKKWLSVQHFTAIIMLLYALSLVTRPGASMTTLGALMHFPNFPLVVGMIFLFCSAFLFGRPVSEQHYRLLTLPLFLYFWAVMVYLLNNPGGSWTGAVSALAVWGFLQIARTDLSALD